MAVEMAASGRSLPVLTLCHRSRASDWGEPVWKGKLHVVAQGDDATVRLLEPNGAQDPPPDLEPFSAPQLFAPPHPSPNSVQETLSLFVRSAAGALKLSKQVRERPLGGRRRFVLPHLLTPPSSAARPHPQCWTLAATLC